MNKTAAQRHAKAIAADWLRSDLEHSAGLTCPTCDDTKPDTCPRLRAHSGRAPSHHRTSVARWQDHHQDHAMNKTEIKRHAHRLVAEWALSARDAGASLDCPTCADTSEDCPDCDSITAATNTIMSGLLAKAGLVRDYSRATD